MPLGCWLPGEWGRIQPTGSAAIEASAAVSAFVFRTEEAGSSSSCAGRVRGRTSLHLLPPPPPAGRCSRVSEPSDPWEAEGIDMRVLNLRCLRVTSLSDRI